MTHKNLVPAVPQKQIGVLLAEDNAKFRKSLKLLLSSEEDMEVVGEAKNGLEAVRLAKSLLPDVVVTDIAMPMLNGLQATRQIVEAFPTIRVLILSANPDPEYIKEGVLCGASGYLIKQSSILVLPQAVREVLKGNSFFCAPIAKPLRDHCRKIFGRGELQRKLKTNLPPVVGAI
jgi:DNA-binding NarL/FixJ family response regulator